MLVQRDVTVEPIGERAAFLEAVPRAGFAAGANINGIGRRVVGAPAAGVLHHGKGIVGLASIEAAAVGLVVIGYYGSPHSATVNDPCMKDGKSLPSAESKPVLDWEHRACVRAAVAWCAPMVTSRRQTMVVIKRFLIGGLNMVSSGG